MPISRGSSIRRVKLALAVGCLLAVWLGIQGLRLPPGFPQPVMVEIEPGTPVFSIAGQLEQAGVLRSRWPFLAWHYLRSSRRTLKAGEYRFDHPLSLPEVYEKLARGDVFYRVLTIPEGYNLFEVAQAVEQAELAPRREFLEAAHNTALVADLAPQAKTLEGFLFPETYHFPRRATPRDVVATMVARFRRVYADLLEKHGLAEPEPSAESAAEPDGQMRRGAARDPWTVITVASLVEKETAQPAERPLISSVYFHRLAARLPLQCDPTVIYAALLDGRYRGAIYQADLEDPSPYNTYVHAGLPPGPIANPGRASLEAALEPADTDYLYFVSDGHGSHVFSRTLEEHQRRVAAYRRTARGGS